MSLRLISPFPKESLPEAWTWHKDSKALTASLGEEGWEFHFRDLLVFHPSWGIELDGELVGIVVIEGTAIFNPAPPEDGQVHIAVARKAWGKEVIQDAAEIIIPEVFGRIPTLQRLSAWTVESNYPARAVAEALGFQMEGKLRDAAPSANGREALLVYGLTRAEVSTRWAVDLRPPQPAPTPTPKLDSLTM